MSAEMAAEAKAPITRWKDDLKEINQMLQDELKQAKQGLEPVQAETRSTQEELDAGGAAAYWEDTRRIQDSTLSKAKAALGAARRTQEDVAPHVLQAQQENIELMKTIGRKTQQVNQSLEVSHKLVHQIVK